MSRSKSIMVSITTYVHTHLIESLMFQFVHWLAVDEFLLLVTLEVMTVVPGGGRYWATIRHLHTKRERNGI